MEFKYFMTALISDEQLLLNPVITSKKLSPVFWKSGENFNLEELTSPMLLGYNFTENFTVDAVLGIFRNV